jgi:hypothetical protein
MNFVRRKLSRMTMGVARGKSGSRGGAYVLSGSRHANLRMNDCMTHIQSLLDRRHGDALEASFVFFSLAIRSSLTLKTTCNPT